MKAIQEEHAAVEVYCVRFATCTIGPAHLPNFSYVLSAIGFSHVVYIALVHSDQGQIGAIEKVEMAWPGAQVQNVVHGKRTLEAHEVHPAAFAYGSLEAKPKLSIFRRFLNFIQETT